jgi:hypothetical protein
LVARSLAMSHIAWEDGVLVEYLCSKNVEDIPESLLFFPK